MPLTLYKPGPQTATRTMGPPLLHFSRPPSTGRAGHLFANAALAVLLRADANSINIQKHGEPIPDDQPFPVIILIDQEARQVALAAALEGERNAVPMKLNYARKATLKGGVRLARKLTMAPGAYEPVEHKINGRIVRLFTYGLDEPSAP